MFIIVRVEMIIHLLIHCCLLSLRLACKICNRGEGLNEFVLDIPLSEYNLVFQFIIHVMNLNEDKIDMNHAEDRGANARLFYLPFETLL